METAILAVVSLLALGLWCDNYLLREEGNRLAAKEANQFHCIVEQNATITRLDSEIAELLRQKNALIPRREQDHDKIPAKPSLRYRSIAERRAAAERASLGPQTHNEQVRENNAKAFGSV